MRKCSHTRPECPFHSLSLYLNAHGRGSATVAGDKQVRVFDVGEAATSDAGQAETWFFEPDSCLRVLRCHSERVKRIVTEESPDLFLSISEVRAHI
jgi:hypothetical protein